MKLLLLGCGDIGERVAARIDRQCWTVAGMRRRADRLSPNMMALVGDVCDSTKLKQVIESQRPEALVVTMTPSAMTDEGYRKSYVAAAKNLRQVLEEAGIQPQVFWVSSSAVYGQNRGEWVDETSPAEPTGFRGQRLLEAENILLVSDLPVSVVRFSGIYGAGRNRLLTVLREGKGVTPISVQWNNRIHSDDCAGVLVHLLQKFRCGESLLPVYLASDDLPTQAYGMQAELAREMGLKVGTGSCLPQGRASGRRCSNRRLRESGYQFRYPTWREGYRAVLDAGG